MRQAINNLQSTWSGFQFVNAENVFKICDQPNPVVIQKVIDYVLKNNVDGAIDGITVLFDQGYSPMDIIGTLFKVIKYSGIPEYLKLEFIKVNFEIIYNIIVIFIVKKKFYKY